MEVCSLPSDASTEGSEPPDDAATLPSDAATEETDDDMPQLVSGDEPPDADWRRRLPSLYPFCQSDSSCCHRKCDVTISNETLDEILALCNGMRKDDLDDYVFDAIRQLRSLNPGPRLKWLLKGQEVCRTAWAEVFCIGHSRLQRLYDHAKKGFTESPADLRKSRAPNETAT